MESLVSYDSSSDEDGGGGLLGDGLVGGGVSEKERKKQKKEKKKKKKKEKKKRKEPEPDIEAEKSGEEEAEKPGALPSAADLLASGSSAKFLKTDSAELLESFVGALGDREGLQRSAPSNMNVDILKRKSNDRMKETRRIQKMEQSMADKRAAEEEAKLEAWRKAPRGPRYDEFGNEIKPEPKDLKGKSFHRWH
eukprot:CAMPEP_0175139522 /NCGR_PEP_ID=MMETSP0087-20121206/10953_1 /TAXON_ID=136419 /ORGANISM="Unknown Unknown, Strain D1" /LENGTH=193 /DNA_ID=CAMNT_0016422549 /DNA_START=32 /DNA_END=613 /DNA_ORIENTATION=-